MRFITNSRPPNPIRVFKPGLMYGIPETRIFEHRKKPHAPFPGLVEG